MTNTEAAPASRTRLVLADDLAHDEAHELLSRIKIDGRPAAVTELLNEAELVDDADEHLRIVRRAAELDVRLRRSAPSDVETDTPRGLALTIRAGQCVRIGDITVWVSRTKRGQAHLVIDAPADVPISR